MTPIFPKYLSDIQYISDVQYIYPTFDIYIRLPYIFQASNIPALALALAKVRYCFSDVGYRYRTSNIDIGCRIDTGRSKYILDV